MRLILTFSSLLLLSFTACTTVNPTPAPKGYIQDPAIYDAPILDSPVRGPKNAQVTIIEFANFDCPFCRKEYAIIKDILSNHQSDVRLVFKHRPVSVNHRALPAGQAGYAAMKQGKFWEMHDKLMTGGVTEDDFIRYAKELKLDLKKFNHDRNSIESIQFIDRDKALALKLSMEGVPQFLINGKKLPGAWPAYKFEEMISQAKIVKGDSSISN